MKTFSSLSLIALVVSLSLLDCARLSASEHVSTERDQHVLQTILDHLRADTNFNLTRIANHPAGIVLHARTPEKTGFLGAGQIRSDLHTNTLPADVETDLRTRNTSPNAKPDTYEAVAATYTNLTFTAGIIVADLSDVLKQPRSYREFQASHPGTCGYVRAYLPGYSSDGTLAVVRATVGPTPHGATITALLEKTGNTWMVKWYRLARYV